MVRIRMPYAYRSVSLKRFEPCVAWVSEKVGIGATLARSACLFAIRMFIAETKEKVYARGGRWIV